MAKGRDADALRAIQEIENRSGGSVKLVVEGLAEDDLRRRLGVLAGMLRDGLPSHNHPVIGAAMMAAMAEDDEP